jgi:hypothetical protein
VVYRSGNVTPNGIVQGVGGLNDGQVYYVIRISDTAIQLAASAGDATSTPAVPIVLSPLAAASNNKDSLTVRRSFNQASEVSATFNGATGIASNTIQFSSNHGFANGQAVVYQPGNANPVSELNAGQVYYVIRTSDTSLQLALTPGDATSTPPKAVTLTPLSSATNLDTLTSRRSSGQAFVESGRIVFGSDPGFNDGQAVVYNIGGASGSIGLMDGQVYFVKRVAGNDRAIELALTPGGASVAITAAAGDSLAVDSLTPAFSFAPTSVNNATDEIVFAAAHGVVDGQRLTYRVGSGNGPMLGLTAGNSYFAEVTGPSSLKLRSSLSGSSIDVESRSTVTWLPVITESASELLVAELNELINGPSLYDAQRFDGIALRPETLQLLSQFPQGNPVLNRLLLEDAYPDALPRIPSLTPDLPAAIYYAQRFSNRAGAETILSTVESVNIRLSGTDTVMNVDSAFGGNTTIEGGTNTTVVIGGTLDGLRPAQNRRVSFIDGSLDVNAATIVLDDSGNDRSTIGVLESDRVTGLGMPGSIRFVGAPSVTVKLGANDDTFYVPGTAVGQSVRLESGGGFDTTYIGTRPGFESTGTLSGLLGNLSIDGGSVQTGLNTLFLNDQSTTTPQTLVVDNDYDWTLAGNTASTRDITTVTRSGNRIVEFTRQSLVALNAGSGGNTVDVHQTHREQSTDGSASSTFTINAGAGSDVITLGEPIGSTGRSSMESFQQDIGAPTFTGVSPSRRGIPVLINGQGGTDVVNLDDTSSIVSTNLGLTQRTFRELFPEAPDANVDSADVYRAIFGDDPFARSLTTIAMASDTARPINVYIRQTPAQSNRTANENMTLSIALGNAGVTGNIVQMVSAPYDLDVAIATGSGNDTINIENGVRMLYGHTLQLNAGEGDDSTFVDFNSISVMERGGVGRTITNVVYDRDSADAGKEGYSPLPPGQYFVETRWNGSDWQFRVVDGNGLAVAVADLDIPNGLLANWQNIRRLPIVAQPDAQTALSYRFDSHRGLILDFSAAYVPTGASLVGAVALDLAKNGFGEVVGVTIEKFGALHRTIASVSFSASDVDAAHRLNANSDLFIQTRWDELNSLWQFRVWNNTVNAPVEIRNVSLPGPNFTSQWQNISSVLADVDGRRVFESGTGLVIEFAPEYEAGNVASSDAMELLLGVPVAQLAFTLDGGTQSANGNGDTLRISGDGQAPGARYIPSSTIPGGGVVTLAGNAFHFRGIEPLIVHGLPDFRMETPDQAAALIIDSADLADSFKQQLQLHTLTVEGQVTWTQKRQFDIERPAMDPRSLGRAIAVSDDGLTMVVGAKATPLGSASVGELSDGMVFVYQWNGSAWIEKARLQPSDAQKGLNFGGGFGASVAIDGNRMIIGAPGDAPSDATVVAAFVPSIANVVNNQVVLTSPHGLSEGQPISYSRGSGYGDIGLNDGQLYYAKLVSGNANALQFALTPGGAAVSLSLSTTAEDQLGSIPFFPSSTTILNNQILLASDTTLANGQAVTYRNGNGDSSFGLIDGETYFVKRVVGNARAIELTLTPEAATDPSGAIVPLAFPARQADAIRLTNYGAAYVFERSDINSPWIETQKLFASQPTAGHFFGASVAIRGFDVLVGAPGDTDSDAGEAAYFYSLSNGNWGLKSRQSGSGDFGRTVALAGNFGTVHFGQSSTSGDFAVIGAPLSDLASVYRVTSVSVSHWTTLTATEPQAGEQFGAAVAATTRPRTDNINGTNVNTQISRIVIGAPLWDGPAAYTGDVPHAEQGRAFVFDLVGSNWVSVARLTAEGGLPVAEAATEARTGDRFGAAVALDHRYVVVGAPNHQSGTSLQTGSAYIFYELKNGSTGANNSSWTRSTGGTLTSTGGPGSGRLEASSPAANDNFGSAVAIWHDPVTGAGRAMVGIPGFDETTGSSRANLGAVRTFSTSGAVPNPAQYPMYAETLQPSSLASQFGVQSLYDEATKTLFVGAPGSNAVHAYVNDGLYWRPLDLDSNPANGITPWIQGSGFGTDMKISGNRMVIGSPGENRAYIYEANAGVWMASPVATLSGTGGFGSSVAILGDRVAVGEPNANIGYSTLGRPGFMNLSTPGNAVVFQRNSNGTWTQERRLVPDDGNLPRSGIVAGTAPISGAGTATVYTDSFRRGNAYSVPSGRFPASDNSVISQGDQLSSVVVGPSTKIIFYDEDGFARDSGRIEIENRSLNTYFMNFTEDNALIPSGVTVKIKYDPDSAGVRDVEATYTAGESLRKNDKINLRDFNDDIERTFLETLDIFGLGRGVRRTETTIGVPNVGVANVVSPIDAYNGVANGRWGTSIAFTDANTVIVGASGGPGRIGVYNLSTGNTTGFTLNLSAGSGGPLLPAFHYTGNNLGLGTELLRINDNQVLAGTPNGNRVERLNDGSPSSANINGPSGSSQFGANNSLASRGSITLAGAPGTASGAGKAYFYNTDMSIFASAGPVLEPYRFNSSTNQSVVDTGTIGFGTAPSIISDGLYVVGNNASTLSQQLLYTFRQRGPGWESTVDLTNTPAPIEKAKLGKSVAIAGSTAVLGAPDFGNHGAVLVFNNVGSIREPRWELQAQLDAPGFQTGDEFGASVAVEGDSLIVGAPGRNGGSGGVYFYQRLDGQWTLQKQLGGSVPNEQLGSSVAIASDYAVAGAPGLSSSATYVYEKLGGEWSFDTRLVTDQPGNKFGTAVHLDSSTLFVGAPGHNSERGAVYVYALAPNPQAGASNVSSTSSLIPTTGISVGDHFGTSIDGSGNFVVVGAPGTASNTGAAYVFDRPTGATPWVQTQLNYASGAVAGDQFGTSVAMDGVQIVVGAPGRSVSGKSAQGEAFSYGLKNNGVWTLETPADLQDHILTGAGSAAGDQVGYAVAISGDFALLGAPQLNGRPGVNDTDGSGYAFVRQVNPPSTKTLPETQSVLVAGASTNTLAGTIDGNAIPTLQFFDIQDVQLKTSFANDSAGAPIVSTLTIQPEGFTAYGLQKFSAEGNITFTNLAPALKLPTDGLFEFIANVDLVGTAPIAIDLDGNGLEFVARSSTGPKFDWNGTGTREATAWLGGNDGWLFIDLSPELQVTRAELSFVATVPTAKSDLDALRIAYDSNKDNVLDSNDADWSKFKIWRDINLDGITTADEIIGLDVAGITSIGLIGDNQTYTAASGGVRVLGEATFTRTDGSQGIVGDVVLNPDIGTVAPGSDRVVASYDFVGGPAATYVADADTDWTLYDGFLTASDGRQRINLDGFTNVVLKGGNGNNRIEIVSWPGNVTIDGGSGRDTILIHAGSGANVTVLDTGSDDQLDIIGTTGPDQILVTPNSIDVFPDGSPSSLLHVSTNAAMTGRLRISGGESDDEITLSGTSFSIIELDGGAGLDQYNLFRSGAGSHTFISDSGPADGTRDKITVLVNGPTVVDGFMNQTDVRYNNPNVPLTYDNSIEDVEVKTVDPKLFLTGNGFFRIGLDLVLFNGVSYPLAGVTDLTITTTGDGSTIQVDQIPLTLNTWTINATAGSGDRLIGTELNNEFIITGTDSGRLTGTPNLNFTGVENLQGRSGADRFIFNTSGSISGSLDGGGNTDIADYSSVTAGITIDLSDGSFSNVETLIGSQGTDNLVGPDADTQWTLLNAGAGSVAGVNFTQIENFTGGDGNDTFHLESNSQVLGSIDGGVGLNRLSYRLSDAADVVTISAPVVTSNGVGTTYSSIQAIDMFSLGGEDQITVSPAASGFPESINIESGDADDSIEVQLLDGVTTSIQIDGGAPSASDIVTVSGTSVADAISVDGLQIAFGSMSILLAAVEDLVIDAGEGDDMISVTGESVTGLVQLNGNGGDDRFEVNFPVASGSLEIDGGTTGSDVLAVNWTNQDDNVTIRSTAIETAGETLIQYTGLEVLELNTFGGDDVVVVAQTHAGATELNTGEGSDTITVQQTLGRLDLHAGDADDDIRVQSIGAATSIQGDDGADSISVGSLSPSAGGVLNGIQALLTIVGNLDADSVTVDASGDAAPSSGTLTNARLTGLGMTEGIDYSGISSMNITLGEFDDAFDIVSTLDGMALELSTGAGADQIHVRSINGSTIVDTGAGSDTVNIVPSSDSLVDSQFSASTVSSAINGLLTVIGGDTIGPSDTLNFTSPFTSVEAGRLTQDRLTGMQMPEGVLYSGWEKLNISLPIDTGIEFTIESTHLGSTELSTGSGSDLLHVQSIAGPTTIRSGGNDDTINVGSTAPSLGGNVNGIGSELTLDGEAGTDSVNIDDSGDSFANIGELTGSTLNGLGMAGTIRYQAFESLRLDLGQGDDTLSVRSISVPTTVNAGAGQDSIRVGSLAPATGGNVNAIAALLTIAGDEGADTLHVDDSGDTEGNTGTLTGNSLSGLGMTGSIVYGGLEALNIALGSGSDAMQVEGTHAGTTGITNTAGEDVVRMIDHLGRLTFVGGPDNDKLLLDSNYIDAPANDPLVTFTRMVDGRQRAGYWSFNATQGLVVFESVERFNHLGKVVTPRGKIRTQQYGIEVVAPAIQSDYSELVANFTVGPVQPLLIDTRAFENPDFYKIDADADADGFVSPLDVLVVINQLNSSDRSLSRLSYDVDKDGIVSPLDVLIVINRLNQPTTYVNVGGDLQIVTRDLNNDGLAEILVTGVVNSRPVLITLNGVTGGLFDAPLYLSDEPSQFTSFVTAGDIDGDGILEIIVSSERGPGKYSIYRRINGRLILSEERIVPFPTGYIGGVRVAAGDINADGKDEILVGSGVGADPSVRAYDQFGNLMSTFVLPSSYGRAGVLIKTGDYDGDGLLDVFVASGRRGGSQVAVFNGRDPMPAVIHPDHQIEDIYTDQSLIAPIDIALADSDGDELDELFTWQLSDGRNQGLKQFKYDHAVDKFFEEF